MGLSNASARIWIQTAAPTVNDDISTGYEQGNWWLNTVTGLLYMCNDDTDGAAVWTLKPTETTNSFTPTLAFGGGSTGLTYGTRTGFYRRIGNLVFISIDIVLTAKGSSTGAATISGLPVTSAQRALFNVAAGSIGLTASYTTFLAQLEPSVTSFGLFQSGPALSVATITDALFVDTSSLLITGVYSV